MESQESPVSNHETGSLTQHSPHESRFVGSSSGVYFINTVKQAFESSGRHHHHPSHLPPAEDTVGGEDDFLPSGRNSPRHGSNGFDLDISRSNRAIQVSTRAHLGTLPLYENAQQFAIAYFQIWHPVLPFLSGPDFLQELEIFYQDDVQATTVDRRRQCYLIILSCVLTMGACTSPTTLPSAADMPSRSQLLSLVGALATRHDILTIQTVLAAQLYCISTMALRTASSLGGILSKLLYHAGLHRCPYRYPQLSDEDRELRKRILWSAYAMDRYVCQALGVPVSLTDAEVDVCVPGRRERHGSVENPQSDVSVNKGPRSDDIETSFNRELVLANFVEHAGLVGRALELFHASLHTRNKDPRKVLFLRSDVDKWYNGLPEEPILTSESTAAEEQIARFLPFFHVLYEQLIITINRPSLSLPRSAPEFHHGLQTTIRAAKRTIVAMERQSHLFWPGYLASIWMSGLIISFACQVGLYSVAQGSLEITRCLALLKTMSDRWRSAQRCHAALSTLLSELTHAQGQPDLAPEDDTFGRASKKPRLDSTISESSPSATSAGLTTDRAALKPRISNNSQDSAPLTSPATWDIDDFFRDLSWNNLFDNNDMAQGADLAFFAG